MAKQRMVNTHMWKDEYFQELTPSEKLLFIYLLTNESTSICGIYKISVKTICFETGINKDAVSKGMDRLSKDMKIYFIDGWVKIANFVKNQNINPKVQKGIQLALALVPKEIQIGFDSLYIAYDDINSNSNSNSNSNLNSNLNNQYMCDFEFIWKQYPSDRRKEKSTCENIYKKHSNNQEKENMIITAFYNYKNSLDFKKGYVLNSDKFFKNWNTYLDYDENNTIKDTDIKKTKGELNAEKANEYIDSLKRGVSENDSNLMLS